MSTALDNLLANAGRNNMLSQDGMFKNADYYRLWLESQKNINPNFGTVIDTGTKLIDGGYSSSNDNFSSNVPSKPVSEAQSYYDYWKDDGISGRDLAQVGGFLTKMPIVSLTDFAMGKNPAGNIGSIIGSNLLGGQANSMEQAIALSNVGGMAGQWAGEQISPGQWRGYNPGRTTAEALGFKEGTKMFDTSRDISMDVISEKVKQGMTVDEAVAEFDKELKENQTYTGPVEIIEGSVNDNARNYLDDPATVVSEPESVSDFVGMFSGTIDGVGDWFSEAYDNITGKFTGMQNEQAGVETPKVGYGKQGDDTWQDNTGTVFHGGGYNWNGSNSPASDSASSGWSSQDEQDFADDIGVSD